MDKKRVRLTVAYDGTNYHGWQLQNNAVTIESVLNGCLSELLGEPIEVIGASRTDAGVHALGNVAVFDTCSRIPGEKFSYALNQRLPEDIRIQGSEEVEAGWHPRRCPSRKTYEYRICRGEFPMPVKRLYSYFTYRPLDVERMRRGAAYLAGLAVGFWKDREEILQNVAMNQKFEPQITELERQKRIDGWKQAVRCAIAWKG